MSEPVAKQIAVAFTRWRCKSRGTPGYNGTPGYSVLHHLYPFNEPNNQSFIRIMSNDESSYIQNLGFFLYHAFKRRNYNLITLSDTMAVCI